MPSSPPILSESSFSASPAPMNDALPLVQDPAVPPTQPHAPQPRRKTTLLSDLDEGWSRLPPNDPTPAREGVDFAPAAVDSSRSSGGTPDSAYVKMVPPLEATEPAPRESLPRQGSIHQPADRSTHPHRGTASSMAPVSSSPPSIHGVRIPTLGAGSRESGDPRTGRPPERPATPTGTALGHQAQAQAQAATTPVPSIKEIPGDSTQGRDSIPDLLSFYLDHVVVEDRETVQTWNSDLDSILIFAALFSAVTTTFIIESYQMLQPDTSSDLLQAILSELKAMRNGSDTQAATVPQFQPAASAVRVNSYWFSSLILSLAAALIAILAKQWVNYLLAGLSSIPTVRARHRQYRMDGMHRWNLPGILSFLPILLHISLLLFFAGLVDFVWDINRTVAVISAVLVSITAIAYFGTNLLAYVFPECPFKTSFTLCVALAVDMTAFGFRKLGEELSNLFELLLVFYSMAMAQLQLLYPTLPLPPQPAGFETELRRTNTMALSRSRLRRALRISSLRADDDKFIAENESLMDARVMLWLMHNASRIRAVERVTYAITNFPDLILHRRLFIAQGACTFLENLLQSWYTHPSFFHLTQDRQDAIVTIVRALALLESEAEPDGPEFSGVALIPSHPPVIVRNLPFVPTTSYRVPGGRPTSHLASRSCRIIISLLNESWDLPLPLVAFALRLSVRMPEVTEYAILQPLSMVLHNYIQRLADFIPAPGRSDDATHAVDTLIYLALHDTSYPQRQGFAIPYMGDARYWLKTLSDIMVRSPLSGNARYHLCWAITTLSWTLRNPSEGIKPRIPRLTVAGDAYRVQRTLVESIAWDTDIDILCAASAALESVLWKATLGEHTDVRETCQLSYPAFNVFMAQMYAAFRSEQPHTDPRIARLAVSSTRIAVYLMMYDPAIIVGSRVHILKGCLEALLHLLQAAQKDATLLQNAARPMPVLRDSADATASKAHLDVEGQVRNWIFRAASRVLTIYLNYALRGSPLQPQPNEIAFGDLSALSTATAFMLALEAVQYRGLASLSQPESSIFEAFVDIMGYAFSDRRGDSMSWVAGGRKPAESDTEFVTEFIRLGGLSTLLSLSMESAVVNTKLLHPVMRFLRRILPQDPIPTPHPSNYHTVQAADGPAVPLLRPDVRTPFTAFVSKVIEGLRTGKLRRPEVDDPLLDLLHTLNHLVFWRRNCRLSDAPDCGLLLKMLAVHHNILGRLGTDENYLAIGSHVCRAVGDLIPSICYADHVFPGPESRPVPDNGATPRNDAMSVDSLAVGLLRTLMITYILRGAPLNLVGESHCTRCNIKQRDAIRILDLLGRYQNEHIKVTLQACVVTALRAVRSAWEHNDVRAVELRNALLRHGLYKRLKIFAGDTGKTGATTRQLRKRIYQDELREYKRSLELRASAQAAATSEPGGLLGLDTGPAAYSQLEPGPSGVQPA